MEKLRIKVSTMSTSVSSKSLTVGAVIAALVVMGVLLASPYAGAQDDKDGSQKTKNK